MSFKIDQLSVGILVKKWRGGLKSLVRKVDLNY
jgi:hypothetical protein